MSNELDLKAIGQRILLARRDLNITQEQLGARIGVDRSYITSIERGRAQNFGIYVLYSIADALGATIPHLLGFESATPRTLREKIIDLVVDDQERQQAENLVQAFSVLSDTDRRIVLNLAQQLSERTLLRPTDAE